MPTLYSNTDGIVFTRLHHKALRDDVSETFYVETRIFAFGIKSRLAPNLSPSMFLRQDVPDRVRVACHWYFKPVYTVSECGRFTLMRDHI